MNKVFLIGNLTRDPELRTTPSGLPVCTFTIAVNRRRASNAQAGQPEADFFRVTAWRQLGENCHKWLIKGHKVNVVGAVSVSTYQTQNGQTRAQLEVTADDVEFLTPANQAPQTSPETPQQPQNIQTQQQTIVGSNVYVQVEDEDLPF